MGEKIHTDLRAAVAFVALFFAGCGSRSAEDDAAPRGNEVKKSAAGWFADVAKSRGVEFVHEASTDKKSTYFMPQSIGSGAAIFDYDDDGKLDLYLLQNGGPTSKATNRLYRLTEQGFADVSAGSGLNFAGHGMGAAAGDVNNDGKVDLLVTEYGRARLLINESSGEKPRFVEATGAVESQLWGTSAAMIDFDRDGWLDIVIVNYVDYDPSRPCFDGTSRREFCGPDPFPGRVATVLRNLTGEPKSAGTATNFPMDNTHGQPVRFENVSVTLGLAKKPGPGLGIFCADFNEDRWVDILVANDGKVNHLWINDQGKRFTEEGGLRGLAYDAMGKTAANMGIAIGDVNGDERFDVFVTHLTEETHTLWMQDTPGFFQDRTVSAGVTAAAWRGTGFGAVMADFDNDGDLDLAFANGRVERMRGGAGPATEGLPEFWRDYGERNQLFINDGRGRYEDISTKESSLCGEGNVARGMAAADFDDDGGIDLVVTRIAQPPLILKNVAADRGRWLIVRAIDPALQRDAYGAEVHLRAGNLRAMRWINPGYSYLCSNDPRAHFGLGKNERVDELRIVWPDGSEEAFDCPGVDRVLVVRRGQGRAVTSRPANVIAKSPSDPNALATQKAHPVELRETSPPESLEDLPNFDRASIDKAVLAAIDLAEAAVRADQNSAAAWGDLGTVFYVHDVLTQAERCLARAAQLDPKNPKWHYLRGLSLAESNRALSIECYRRAADAGDDAIDTPRLRMIELLIEDNRLDEAQREVAAFLARHPNSGRALVARGRLFLQMSDLKTATEALTAAAGQPMFERAARRLLAEVYRRQGDVARSDEELVKVRVAKSETWPDPYYQEAKQREVGLRKLLNESDIAFGAGDVPKSSEILQQAAVDYPDNEFVHIRLARNFIRQRKLGDAERAIEKALAINPRSVEAIYRLGIARREAKRIHDAADQFQRAIDIKPDFADAHHMLGQCLLQLGRKAQAQAAFEATLRNDPAFLQAYITLAEMAIADGEQAKARGYYEQALKLEISDEETRKEIERRFELTKDAIDE